jgi:hypothetical protein
VIRGNRRLYAVAADEADDARVEAVPFDFSGTLFDDTVVLDAAALVAAAARHGVTLDEAEADDVIRRTLRHVDSPEGSRRGKVATCPRRRIVRSGPGSSPRPGRSVPSGPKRCTPA